MCEAPPAKQSLTRVEPIVIGKIVDNFIDPGIRSAIYKQKYSCSYIPTCITLGINMKAVLVSCLHTTDKTLMTEMPWSFVFGGVFFW